MCAEKRGQISVFVILALVLAVSAIVLMVLWRQGAIFQPEESVPQELASLKRYVETCMGESAQEGITLLELQGGYIDLRSELPDTLFDPSTYVDGPPKVPLWHHKGSSRIPTRRQMESRLSDFVDEQLDVCLDNLTLFKKLFEIKELAGRTLEVTINDESISFVLHYPLTIQNRGSQKIQEISEFKHTVDTSLGKLHLLATEIMAAENTDAFLEELTNDMIASSDYLPNEGMEVSCKPKVWSLYEIEDYIRTLVSVNLQFISFENTYLIPTGYDYYDKLYTVDVTDRDFRDVSVRTQYDPSWNMNVDVSPRKGTTVRPISINQGSGSPVDYLASSLMGVCLKLYHHRYSVSYPVLFELNDVTNPDDVFFFATPVIMTAGQPNRQGLHRDFPEPLDNMDSEVYCDETTPVTTYSVDPATGRIIYYEDEEAPNERVPLSVEVVELTSGMPLDNVSILYQCVKFLCRIGSTGYTIENGFVLSDSPVLDTSFPTCFGGLLIAEKEGFLRTQLQQSILPENANQIITLAMPRLKPFHPGFMILERQGVGLRGREPTPDESLMVILRNDAINYEEVIFLPSDNELLSNLEMPVGPYNLSVQVRVFKNNSIVGAADYYWQPEVEALMTGDFAMFFAIAYSGDAGDAFDPESDEWNYIMRESPNHKVKII